MKAKGLVRVLLLTMMAIVFTMAGIMTVACGGEKEKAKAGPEGGEYYFDANGREYLITLSDGNEFTFVLDEERSGSYSLSGTELTLNFETGKNGTPETIIATLRDYNSLSFTYRDVSYVFLRKVTYAVHFKAEGAAPIADQSVLNGKKATRPNDPEYSEEEYVFVDWYSDSACTKLYDFDSPVTSETTVYAKRIKANEYEFTISFDLGYEAENPASVKTVGGLVAKTPVPERDGFTFLGWWVSMENRAERLSYLLTSETVFHENTTLFALWKENGTSSRLDAPAVSVKDGMISWQAVSSASTYRVKIVDPQGKTVAEENFGGTAYPYEFGEEGDYEISVTALASNHANDSESTTRYYRNKGLYRVSIFSVDDEKRVFGFLPVENAKQYLITVKCGDENHKHENADLAGETKYDFSGCAMREEGISFTVMAVADGFVTSVSEEYIYERHLEGVENLRVEDASLSVKWDEVEHAVSYKVEIGSDSFLTEECEATLKYYGKGSYTIKVTPMAPGFNSPAPTSVNFEKKIIATPENLKLELNTLTWDKVSGATGYKVRIGDKEYTTQENKLDITDKIEFQDGKVAVSVCAVEGTTETPYGEELILQSSIENTVKYSANTLVWFSVPGAKYEVRIDDGTPVSTNESSMKITLPHAGEVRLAVRFYVTSWSEWEEITVTAYTLSFDCGSGVGISPRFYAAGDTALLDVEAENPGYSFAGWYSAAENGSRYGESTVISGDLTVYAQYSPMKYTLKLNDGTDTTSEASVTYRESYELPVPVSEDGTYAFDGWWSNEGGTGTRYTDSEGKSLSVWTVTGDAEVYAHWVALFKFEKEKLPGNASKEVWAVSKGELFTNNSYRDLLENFTTVTIPEKHLGERVGIIHTDAFAGCTSIKTIRIPDTIALIFSNPFGDRFMNDGLEAVEVYAVKDNQEVRYASFDGVLYDYGAVDDQLTSKIPTIFYVPAAKTGELTVMDGTESIPTQVFDHSELTSVIIPASVKRIAPKAFYVCRDLVTVTILDPEDASPVGLTIEALAFFDCQLLETVNLPARLEKIALSRYILGEANGTPASQPVQSTGDEIENAFYLTPALKNLNAQKGENYSSKDGVLYNGAESELLYVPVAYQSENFVVPMGVTKIANGAFFFVPGVQSVEIASSVQSVGELAFYMSGIVNVTFKGSEILGEAVIEKYAFREALNLKTVSFDENSGVTTLKEGAFYGCALLGEFVMPDSLYNIGAQAFRGCSALESITFGNSDDPVTFGENAFYQSGLKKLIIPKTATKLPELAGLDSLGEIVVDGESEYFTSKNNIIFNKQETQLLFYPRSKTEDYTIPETVTEIGSGAFQNALLTKVTIGEQVTKIGDSAFSGSALTTLEFSGNRGTELEIGVEAFAYTKLTSVNLPIHTKKVGEKAFYCIKELTTLTLNNGLESIGDEAFAGKEGDYYDPAVMPQYTNVVIPASVTEMGMGIFAYAEKLATVTFGGEGAFTLDRIPAMTFAGTAIVTIEIPASVKTIGESAFAQCTSLTTVNFGEHSQVETIGEGAFSYCSALVTITIPASVKMIGKYAFAGYQSAPYKSALKTIDFEESDKDLVISDYAFQRAALVNLKLPARVVKIGENCFMNCTSLESIDLSETKIEYIPELAFQSCRALTNVELPKTLKYIGDSAFMGCSALEEITLPVSMCDYNGYDAIGENAFKSSGLKRLLLAGDNFTGSFTIGDEAFYGGSYSGVNSIEKLELPATLTKLPDEFFGEESYSWYGPSTYEAFFTSLTEIKIKGTKNGQLYTSVDGALYNGDKTELVAFPPAKAGTWTIPESMETVAKNALKGCSKIEEIVIPASWENFDKSMFSDCTGLQRVSVAEGGKLHTDSNGVVFSSDNKKLVFYPTSRSEESYTIPATVTEIGDAAFENVKNLKTVTFAGTADLTIGKRAFANSGLTSFEFPKELVSIGEQAFYGCVDLLTVTAEDNSKLTELPKRLFENCSKLKTLEIPDHVKAIPDADGDLNSVYDDHISIVGGCSELTKITIKGSELTKIGAYGLYIEESSWDDLYCVLETVELPASLKEIGHHAFYSNTKLKSLGNNDYAVTDVGNFAFYNCELLDSFKFTEGLKTIGESAFYKTALTEITIPKSVTSIGNDAFRLSKLQKVSGMDGALDLGQYIFMSCAQLTTVDLKDGLTEIGKWMFRDCSNLTSVTLPATLKTIREYAFYECGSLTEIDLKNVSTIEESAFASCGLQSVTLPATLTSLEESVFENCSALKTVVMSAKLASIPAKTFRGCGILVGFTLPTVLTSIGEYAFANCSALVTIDIPESVTSIGDYAFSGCGLTTVKLPRDLAEIGSHLFDGCASLTSVELPTQMKEIGQYMFAGTGFTQYTIPDHIATVGAYAFSGCNSLAAIVIGTGVTEIGEYAFEGCALVNVTIPSTVKTLGAGVLKDNKKLSTVTLPEGIESIPDYMFAGTGLTQYTVPATVTKIGAHAFEGCSDLQFTFPANVTEYGEYALAGVLFETVTIPASMSSIPAGMFKGNTKLNTVLFAEGCTITSVGAHAFEGCVALKTFDLTNVTTIGESAFAGCTVLSGITLSETLQTIGDGAFKDCKGLTALTIPASVDVNELDFASVFEGCDNLEFTFSSKDLTIYKDVVYGKNKEFLFFLPKAKTRNYVIIMEGADLTAESSIANTGLFGDYSSQRGMYTWIKYMILLPGVKIGNYCFEDWSEDRHIYFVGMEDPGYDTPEGWESSWDSSCDAEIHWNVEFDPEKDKLPWETEEETASETVKLDYYFQDKRQYA